MVGCRVHGKRRYTLYPAGHYPYGRVAVVAYSAGGELLLDADSGGPAWQATLFGAGAGCGEGSGYGGPSKHWWERLDGYRRRSQGRRLEMAGRLTGVSGGLKEREREQIATRLGVATMTVLSGAHRWGRSWPEPRGSDRGGAGWRWRAARRWGTAWVRLVRSAICGGHRARGWWRAGSRPARAGWWPRAAVPKRGNGALPAALGDGHRRPRKRPFEPSRTALR